MDSNIKIAREMLMIAKELVAVSDFSKKNTFNKAMGTKLNTNQFREVSKALKQSDDEDEDLSDATMDKVAEELLTVASELLNDKGE